MADDKMSVRERRAQNVKKIRKPLLSGDAAPKLIGWGIVILIIAAVVGGMAYTFWKQGQCPGHWHSTFYIVIDDEKVDYRAYDMNNPLPMRYHLHSPDDYTWHFEPPQQECVGFEEPLKAVHTDLNKNSIKLTGDRHAATGMADTYTANETHTVKAYHATGWSDDWKPISIKRLNDRQLADGEKALVLYGQYTDEQIAEWQAQVPMPPGEGTVTDHDG